MDEAAACSKVAVEEFPEICGGCDPTASSAPLQDTSSKLAATKNANATIELVGGGVSAVALLALLLFASRPSTRAYVRTVFGKASASTHNLTSVTINRTASPTSATPASTVGGAGQGVLLDGTAKHRAGLSWYKSARVQLLAAPDGSSEDAPSWSALVVDGVSVPYDEVAWVRADESTLEFVVARTPRSPNNEDEPAQQRLRMPTRSEFNLWSEALHQKITNPTEHSKPLRAVSAAREWLTNAMEGSSVASCSSRAAYSSPAARRRTPRFLRPTQSGAPAGTK